MPQNQRKKKKGGRKRKVHPRHMQLSWRGPTFMPPRWQTTLRFSKEVVMSNVASGWANVRFAWTSCYDVDPILGSTSMPGFAELAAIYRYYRAVRSSIRVDFGNLDNLSGTAVICPVNFDPTANTTTYQNYLSSRSAKHRPIGSLNGTGAVSVRHATSIKAFGGTLVPALDSYAAVVTTVPVNNIYWLVGCYMNNVMTNGVTVNVFIDITLVFFELSTPAI